MSNILTSTEIKSIVTPVVAFDPSFFDTSIQFIEDTVIKCILTEDLYDALVLAVANPPLNAAYQALFDRVKLAESYAVAFASYEKDLERETNNQGMMENHTQYSKTANAQSTDRILAKIKEREFFYCEELGNFLLNNSDDYPLFDADAILYEPNFRRFFPI
jgi:hypothetical protein